MDLPTQPLSPTSQENENLLQNQKTHGFKIPLHRTEGLQGCWGEKKSTVLLLAKEPNSLVKIKSNLSGGQKLSLKMYFLRVPRIHWCGSRVLDVWGLTSIYRSDLNPNDTISSTAATLCPQSGLGAGVFQVQHITDCVTNASLIFAPQLEAAPWRAGTVTFHPSSDTTLDVA